MTRTVAIVGAGIGAQHLDGFLALPERFRVATICDLNGSRAEAIGSANGIPTRTDLRAVVNDPYIDIVDICLPPHLHLATCVEALEAGKTVICEKPLVTSLAEADALAAAVEATGLNVFPVFQYRFGPGFAQLRHLIDKGLAGRCYAGTLETHWSRDAEYYAIDWRGTWAGEKGGALLGHAIHIHDMLTAALGPVARVYAETATRVNDIETEDCAALSIRMADGALITSSVTLGAADNTSRLRLMFEGFTVESGHAPYAPAAHGWNFIARAPTSQGDIDTALATLSEPQTGYAGFFAAIADALDGKTSDAVTFADGRRSLEFVTAAYHSARTASAANLPLTRDHPLYQSWQP
ncbi:MAG: Gfo/Idh/MocA family oxidoreductase [Silicimonas sp.]|nr:Gfo/Idh/MocA family oxidoreductase [Silicimonas sp.]